ncbi:MAG: hypothetical protein H0S79_26860 [Anaerolineaceae bacterium]|nr:hypothetical protein [Anaerolineaceae bacterium]
MKKLSKILVIFTVLAGVVLLAVPTGTVAAQSDVPPVEEAFVGLEEMFADMQERYEQAGEQIDNADNVIERLEQRIEDLTEMGEDPAELQAILDNFLANMDAVQAVYDDLGELFDEHAGFDADGEVTDDSLAVYTLRQIADGLLDLHQMGEDARFELRWDLMEYRYGRRGDE